MDKSWVYLPRPIPAYGAGARAFVAKAMGKLGNPPKIQCPCTRCRNIIFQTSDDVVSDLIMFGMDETYKIWIFHGEEYPSTSSKMTCDRDEIPNTYRMFVDAHVNDEEIANYTEDALSRALRPERNGRVRGMGFSITPSQVGVLINSSKKVQVFENKVSELKNEMADLKNLLMQTIASKGNENDNTSSPRSQNGSSHVVGSTTLNVRNERFNGDVGRKCKLLNWQKTAVAKASIASMDPNDVAHHVPLGKDVWKVWVNEPLDPKAPLWRPNSAMSVIEDAIGSTVAWHKDFITLD